MHQESASRESTSQKTQPWLPSVFVYLTWPARIHTVAYISSFLVLHPYHYQQLCLENAFETQKSLLPQIAIILSMLHLREVDIHISTDFVVMHSTFSASTRDKKIQNPPSAMGLTSIEDN